MYPGHSRTTTWSVCRRAIATVSSVLHESTTMSSSAHATDASASPTSAASFLVMTVTESFGTRGKVKTLKLKEQSQSAKVTTNVDIAQNEKGESRFRLSPVSTFALSDFDFLPYDF